MSGGSSPIANNSDSSSEAEKKESPTVRSGLFPERLDKEVLRTLPLIHFEGKISLISKDQDIAAAIEEIRKESILGFDTETKPTFRKEDVTPPPALLQLASQKQVWLFPLRQISMYGDLFSILADPSIEKVGVAPHDDIKGLQRLYEFTAQGFTDVSQIASRHGIITNGLRNLSGMFLNGRISKSAQVTNWEQYPLTPKQIKYAATDAWASLAIHKKICQLLAKTGQ